MLRAGATADEPAGPTLRSLPGRAFNRGCCASVSWAGTFETAVFEGEQWFDPLEQAVRGKVRSFIEAILEEELEASLSRKRYERHGDGRAPAAVAGHRHGHRERTLT